MRNRQVVVSEGLRWLASLLYSSLVIKFSSLLSIRFGANYAIYTKL